MYRISKVFEFDYGHRVYDQELRRDLTRALPKCRNLHGHRGKVEIHLTAMEVDSQGMVTDFHHLDWFKEWVDENMDHKMLLFEGDPVALVMMKDPNVKPGLTILPLSPTAENLARFIYEKVKETLMIKGLMVQVERVVFWETPKCKAEYYE